MRRLLGCLLLLALISIGLSSGAQAAPLGGATLSISMTGFPALSFVGTASGSASSHGSVSIASAAFPLPGGTASPTNPATVTNLVVHSGGGFGTGTGGIFLGSGSGTVGAPGTGAGNLRGTMPITGLLRFKGLGVTGCAGCIPLRPGAPWTGIATQAGFAVTVFNNAWTANTANVTFTSMNQYTLPISSTLSYFFHVPFSGSSNMYQTGTTTLTSTQSFLVSQMGTPLASTMGSRVFSLVTPMKIQTTLAASPVVPTFGRLTVRVVPEAGTLLLLGSGTLGLGLVARRRGQPGCVRDE